MGERLLFLERDAPLVGMERNGVWLAIALIRHLGRTRYPERWSPDADEAVVAFLRDWDSGLIVLALERALGVSFLSLLFDEAHDLAIGEAGWSRQEAQEWLWSLADGEAMSGVRFSEALGPIAAIRASLRNRSVQ